LNDLGVAFKGPKRAVVVTQWSKKFDDTSVTSFAAFFCPNLQKPLQNKNDSVVTAVVASFLLLTTSTVINICDVINMSDVINTANVLTIDS